MNLTEAMQAAVVKLTESGTIEKQIEAALQKCVAGIIEEQIARTYSDFGKQLEAAVKKSLAIVGEIDLPSYNDTILKYATEMVAKRTNAVIQQQVVEQLKDVLTVPPEQITLTELVKAYKEHLIEYASHGCSCDGTTYGEITCIVDTSDSWGSSVALHPEPNKREHECDIRVRFNKEGKVYSLQLNRYSEKTEKALFVGPFFQFEKLLFQMKAAGTKFVLDTSPHNLDLEYSHSDD